MRIKSRQNFPTKTILKDECFPWKRNLTKQRDIFIFIDHLGHYEKWEINDNLDRKYCHLNWRQITWVSSPLSKYAGYEACVIEDIMKELHTKIISPFPSEFSRNKKASILITPCPAAAASCSLQLLSAYRLHSLEVTQSNSKFSLSTPEAQAHFAKLH